MQFHSFDVAGDNPHNKAINGEQTTAPSGDCCETGVVSCASVSAQRRQGLASTEAKDAAEVRHLKRTFPIYCFVRLPVSGSELKAVNWTKLPLNCVKEVMSWLTGVSAIALCSSAKHWATLPPAVFDRVFRAAYLREFEPESLDDHALFGNARSWKERFACRFAVQRRWDFGAICRTVRVSVTHAAACCMCALDSQLFLGCDSGELVVCDVDSGKTISRAQLHAQHITSVLAARMEMGGQRELIVFTAGAQSWVDMWSGDLQHLLEFPAAFDGPVLALAFSEEHRLLAAASRARLFVWNVDTCQGWRRAMKASRLSRSDGIQLQLAFVDTRLFVANACSAKVFDAATGRRRASWKLPGRVMHIDVKRARFIAYHCQWPSLSESLCSWNPQDPKWYYEKPTTFAADSYGLLCNTSQLVLWSCFNREIGVGCLRSGRLKWRKQEPVAAQSFFSGSIDPFLFFNGMVAWCNYRLLIVREEHGVAVHDFAAEPGDGFVFHLRPESKPVARKGAWQSLTAPLAPVEQQRPPPQFPQKSDSRRPPKHANSNRAMRRPGGRRRC